MAETIAEKQEWDNADDTLHGFNVTTNITVIENPVQEINDTKRETVVKLDTTVVEITIDVDSTEKKTLNSCEGSDSGVEVVEAVDNVALLRTNSANSENVQDFKTITPAQSYDSSIISYGSNYDEAYNILARRNSTLFEDYKLRSGDGTSEGGSESSSVASARNLKRISSTGAKKKTLAGDKTKRDATVVNKTRSKTTTAQKSPMQKSTIDKKEIKTQKAIQKQLAGRTKPPDKLNLINPELKCKSSTKVHKTPLATPSDDGRWPSVNSKPTPIMARSVRGLFNEMTPKKQEIRKTLEQYGTLPRRRREKSAENVHDLKKTSRESSMTRSAVLQRKPTVKEPAKSLPPYPKRRPTVKTKIYHETGSQTVMTTDDIDKALSGVPISPTDPNKTEKIEISVQVDEIKIDEYQNLKKECDGQKIKLDEMENRLKTEILEKEELKEELRKNTERVLALLGNEEILENPESSDSLLMLESRFQNVSQVIVSQENEISKLNTYCRTLKMDLNKAEDIQTFLLQQQKEKHEEELELRYFMQEEKNALSDALKEAEDENKRHKEEIKKLRLLLMTNEEKSKQLVKMEEQSRHEMYSLQARLSMVETKGRELLVHQGSNVSGAAVALTGLISRLDVLLEDLVSSYNISQQDLDDVVFHNEVYSNSSDSPDVSPGIKTILKDKTPSPKGAGSTFISAVINAIKNATSQTPFMAQRDASRDTLGTDNSNSSELLDSETEPCLMMEPVLEDVMAPDGHSHNMVSSHSIFNCPRLTRSESLTNFSLLKPQISDQTESLNCSFTSETSNSEQSNISLVDQVIEVDNLITRLLKVIRIVQIDNEQVINELQDERDEFFEQINKHRESNKIVVKQLQDWETLGAKLKGEVKELMQQLNKKSKEIEDSKCELNGQRKEVERLNQDVCELSTALSKAEHEAKIKEEEAAVALRRWSEQGDVASNETLGRILIVQKDFDLLKRELNEKTNQLNEITNNKQLLMEHLKGILGENKKQYEAIDNVLGVLHDAQSLVNLHPELVKVQQELEKVCMMTASKVPLLTPSDYNANAAVVQAVPTVGVMPQINSTA